MGELKYKASLTREHFLFYETRTVARLMLQDKSEIEIVEEVVRDNLFQYPTERIIKNNASACYRRLSLLGDHSLIEAIANQSFETTKQIVLYAIMKDNLLVWEFMVTVIGEKYRVQDFSYGRSVLNNYFLRLQEQNDVIASWSDSTISKLKSVIGRLLIETEYINDFKADYLNPVWLNPLLENVIRSNHDEVILPAFNCFS